MDIQDLIRLLQHIEARQGNLPIYISGDPEGNAFLQISHVDACNMRVSGSHLNVGIGPFEQAQSFIIWPR